MGVFCAPSRVQNTTLKPRYVSRTEFAQAQIDLVPPPFFMSSAATTLSAFTTLIFFFATLRSFNGGSDSVHFVRNLGRLEYG